MELGVQCVGIVHVGIGGVGIGRVGIDLATELVIDQANEHCNMELDIPREGIQPSRRECSVGINQATGSAVYFGRACYS